jgi:hypothetical protein
MKNKLTKEKRKTYEMLRKRLITERYRETNTVKNSEERQK